MITTKWLLLLLLSVLHFPPLPARTYWINNDSIKMGSTDFVDGSTLRPVLLNNSNPSNFPAFGCGFYGNRTTNAFYFTVFAVQFVNGSSTIVRETPPLILWTANPANPVPENATLDFYSSGCLDLSPDDSYKTAWFYDPYQFIGDAFFYASNDGVLKIVGRVLTEEGYRNLWQSSDSPTDTWLPWKNLKSGQRLIARNDILSSNLTPGSFYLSFQENNLYAFVEYSNHSQMYRQVFRQGSRKKQFKTGSLNLSVDGISNSYVSYYVPYQAERFQYIRLDPDGHLRVYQWVNGVESIADDILTDNLGNCSYPTVCGNYGICSNGSYCSCPAGNYGNESFFMKYPNLSLGCKARTQISCRSSHLHSFIELEDVSYSGFVTLLSNTDIKSCKQACLNNCTCKAALFQYNANTSEGNCSLPSQILSLMSSPRGLLPHNSTTFIKVQSAPNSIQKSRQKKSRNMLQILVLVFVVATITVFVIWFYTRKHRAAKEEGRETNVDTEWENLLLLATNLSRRFTYQELKSATENFQKKLGGGGFGSVFEGALQDGTKIAVKRLDWLGQGKKEFLAEVKTLGSIHHLNLVTLMGFCVESSSKLLVYKYMSNGSLDKWIFSRNPETALEWKIRKKIILNIAKGLTYLHEDCEMRIVHLDIKPQNILLDDNFNAKLSDFGLARLMDRNQSQVTTQLRGTRGYMAPEWMSRRITEKVDVYSFGVVVLEVVCGRKNLDFSQPEEDDYVLLPIVKQKAEEDRLSDLVDKCGKDMQIHIEDAVKMIRIAIWCLHSDHRRRPSMSTVVKVLEGVMSVEHISDYNILTSIVVEAPAEVVIEPSTPQSASILSGPR